MSNFCIVSEFNPLHNGHEYLLRAAKERGAQAVVCVMSGNATQRGELAITDKYLRAEAAIRCGADLVLELPYPWSCASADYFATAATYIASFFGNTLFFGSECGDIDTIDGAASYCESEEFANEYKKRIQNGEGAATAYLACLEKKGFGTLSSNDLLGVAYLRAVKRADLAMRGVTVKREGAAYNEQSTVDSGYQSATALRALAERGELDKARAHMPSVMYDILARERAEGRLTDTNELDAATLCYFRLASPENLENIAETAGGLANRVCAAAHESTSADEMFSKLRTKRYTDARLRRAMLFCMTGVEKAHLDALPDYTILLAANDKGRELLAKNKKSGGICVVTKPADAPVETAQYKLGAALDSIYGLARRSKYTSGEFLRKNAYIEIKEKT